MQLLLNRLRTSNDPVDCLPAKSIEKYIGVKNVKYKSSRSGGKFDEKWNRVEHVFISLR